MSKRLLLADDSVTIQKVIGITFANEDYQLDIVDNGDSALEHARAQRPDMILADVYMPGKNGYELCAAIKQDPHLASIPVMLLTGTFEPFDEDKARQVGADTWISKPFESQFLIDQVEALLAKVASSPVAVPVAEPESWDDVPAEEDDLLGLADEEPQEEQPVAAAAELESWGDVSVEEDDLLELADEEPQEEQPVAVAAEPESWGDVSVEEDDLLELADEEPQETPVEDDIWGAVALEDDNLLGDEFSVSEAPTELAATEDDTAWGEIDDEIFDLEDVDIIEEADLLDELELQEESPVSEPLETITPPGQDDELLDELPSEVASQAATEQMDSDVESSGFDAESAAETLSEPLAETMEPEPVAAEPVPVNREVTLDEDQVAQIVERVATEVVERLAASLLEKIAWEVVPDLAESLIKDEIRKIKSSLQ